MCNVVYPTCVTFVSVRLGRGYRALEAISRLSEGLSAFVFSLSALSCMCADLCVAYCFISWLFSSRARTCHGAFGLAARSDRSPAQGPNSRRTHTTRAHRWLGPPPPPPECGLKNKTLWTHSMNIVANLAWRRQPLNSVRLRPGVLPCSTSPRCLFHADTMQRGGSSHLCLKTLTVYS